MESSRAASIWEGTAGKLIALLILVPVLGFAPQMIWNKLEETQTPKPIWVNQLLVTAGTWPLADGRPDMSAEVFERFLKTASGADQAYAPSSDLGVNAAALLTGLRPSSSGVRDSRDKLRPGTWTMAKGARLIGNPTGAFLEQPLVTRMEIGGFDELREEPNWGAAGLANAAFDFWERHADRPSFLWLHLAEAGPGAANIADLMERLTMGPDGLGALERAEMLIALTALKSDGAMLARDDSGFRVPLYISLPGGMSAGTRGSGMVLLWDAALAINQGSRIADPTASFDSRKSIVGILQGAEIHQWGLLQGPKGHAMRMNLKRIWMPGEAPGEVDNVRGMTASKLGQDRNFQELNRPTKDFAPRRLYPNLLKELMPRLNTPR